MSHQKQMRNCRRKRIGVGFYLAGVAIAVVMFIISVQNVSGSSTVTEDERAYFHQIEENFRDTIRMELELQGYHNSGITMTSIIELDGRRIYTIALHHDLISDLDAEKQEELINKLAENTFPEEQCQIVYQVLD